MHKGDILGIVTKTDIVKYFADNFAGRAQVKDIMSTTPKTVKETQSVYHAAKEMKKMHVKRLVVMRDNKPAGVISERDLGFATIGLKATKVRFFQASIPGRSSQQVMTYPLIVGDVMQTNLVTANPEEDAAKVAKRLVEKEGGSAIVMHRSSIAGIVTSTDFNRWVANRKE